MPAVIGFVAKAFATGFLKGVLGRILISVALGAVQSLLAKARSDRAAAANRGIRGEVTLSGAKTPMAFVIGRYATGGRSIVAPYTFGTNNNYMTYVISLGCRRGGSLAKLIVNGEVVELATTSHATYGLNVTGKYADKMWVRFRDGSETTADSFLLSQFGSHPDRPWSSDMIGRDSVTAIVTFFYDDEVYPGGNVDVRFELTDIPFYDPRKDTTAGGAGAHRFNDPATWEPTKNPVVMIYNILRGIEIAGVGVWGGNSDADDFRFSEWSAAMTKSNPRYKAGYEVYLSDKPADIVNELLKACSGQVANIGGTWRISVGAPDAAVYYFSDDDLVVSESSQFDPFPGIDSTINTVVASYVNPAAMWEVSEAVTVTDATYIASDDNRTLEADLPLSAVFDDEQAQDLAETMLADSRRFRSHIHTLPLSAMFLEPLDTISWTSEHNGYVTKLFEIGQLSADVLGCVPSVTTRERDPDDYDFGGGIPYVPPVFTTTPYPTSVDGFTITGYILTDGTNDRRPALRLAWEPSAMSFAKAIRYQVRLTDYPDTITHEGAHSDPASGVVIISGGVLPATSYQVRVKVVAKKRVNPWSGWITVMSPDVRLGSVELADDINATLDEADRVVAEYDALVAGFAGTLVDALDDAASLANAGLEGWLVDPTFRQWTAGDLTAANWSSRGGTATYAVSGGGAFGGGMTVNVPATSAEVFVIAASDVGQTGADPGADYLVASLHLTYDVGDPNGGRLRVEWSNDGVTWVRGECLGLSESTGQFSTLGIGVKAGVRQGFQYLWKRPDGITAKVRVVLYAKTASPAAATQMIVHLLNLGPATQAQIDAGRAYTVASATPGETVTTAGIGAAMVQLNSAMTTRVSGNEASIETLETVTADTNSAVAIVRQTLSATANAGTAYFRDTFDGDLSMWEVNVGLGSGEVAAILSSGGVGPKVLKLGNNAGNDTVWMAHKHLIPFDPNKLYKMTVRARRVSGTGTFYAGFLGVAADGVTLVNSVGANLWSSQHYHAVGAAALGASFEDRSGYTEGRASVGVAGVGTVSNPSEVHTNVAFLRPLIIANYSAVAGVHEIAHVTVDDGSIVDLPATVETQAAVISGLTNTAMYSIRVNTSGGESKMELVSSSDPSGPATAINLVSDNILMRASNVLVTAGSNIYPDYDMLDDNFYYTSSSAAYSFLTASSPSVGQRYITIPSSVVTDNELVYTQWFRVEPSTEYLIRGGSWLSATGAGVGTATLYSHTGEDDGMGNITLIAQTLLRSVTDTGFSSGGSITESTLITPSNCRAFRFLMFRPAGGTGHARFGGFSLQKKAGASLIVDGSITAQKLSVTSLGAVSATIGILRTATSGARLEVRSDKLLVYDASNILRVRIGNLA